MLPGPKVEMKIGILKHKHRIEPLYPSDVQAFIKLPDGEYQIDIKQVRNLKHHRKFFAILTLVCANSEKWDIPEQVLAALKIKLGYYNWVTGFDGEMHAIPGSINFGKMDQAAFIKFYDAALPLLAKEIGITADELETNYKDYM